jgi:hypothetical protein
LGHKIDIIVEVLLVEYSTEVHGTKYSERKYDYKSLRLVRITDMQFSQFKSARVQGQTVTSLMTIVICHEQVQEAKSTKKKEKRNGLLLTLLQMLVILSLII